MDATDDFETIEMAETIEESIKLSESFKEVIKKFEEAYNEASDDSESYDEAGGLFSGSKRFLYLMKQALKAADEQRYDDSVEILEMAVGEAPDNVDAKMFLAMSYSITGHTVKAIDVWKELFEAEPDNTSFSFFLGRAYYNRNWKKKAQKQFEHTLELDPDHTTALLYVIECLLADFELDLAQERCFNAIARLKEKGEEEIELYNLAFFISLINQTGTEMEYLDAMAEIFKNDKTSEPGEYNEDIESIILTISNMERLDLLPYVRKLVAELPGISESVLTLMDSVENTGRIEALSDYYPEAIYSLMQTIDEGCDCEDCQNDIMAMECSMLADIEGYRPYINRLSLEHPSIYAMHSSFFDELLSGADLRLLLKTRIDTLKKQNLEPMLLNADASRTDITRVHPDGSVAPPVLNIETFRRDGPKIGRNDPCPCGSGKKYKKCHGV